MPRSAGVAADEVGAGFDEFDRDGVGGDVGLAVDGEPGADGDGVVAGVERRQRDLDSRTRLAVSGRLRTGTGLDLSLLAPPTKSARSTQELLQEDRGA